VVADSAMLLLGGSLKRKESLSARLGDVLSYLYLASTVLKYHVENGSQESELIYVRWCLDTCLYNTQKALEDFFNNFPYKTMAKIAKRLIFPFGLPYKAPSDKLNHDLAKSMAEPSELRDRLSYLCYRKSNSEPLGRMERAFDQLQNLIEAEHKIHQALHNHQLPKDGNALQHIQDALALNIITEAEAASLQEAEAARIDSLEVDEFEFEYFKNK
jgi:acyl-CoA dehydrogenase